MPSILDAPCPGHYRLERVWVSSCRGQMSLRSLRWFVVFHYGETWWKPKLYLIIPVTEVSFQSQRLVSLHQSHPRFPDLAKTRVLWRPGLDDCIMGSFGAQLWPATQWSASAEWASTWIWPFQAGWGWNGGGCGMFVGCFRLNNLAGWIDDPHKSWWGHPSAQISTQVEGYGHLYEGFGRWSFGWLCQEIHWGVHPTGHQDGMSFLLQIWKKQVDPLYLYKLWGLPRAVETSIHMYPMQWMRRNVPKKQGCSCLFWSSRTSMYVRTDIIDGCAVSRLVRLEPGESPPVWDGEDWGRIMGTLDDPQPNVTPQEYRCKIALALIVPSWGLIVVSPCNLHLYVGQRGTPPQLSLRACLNLLQPKCEAAHRAKPTCEHHPVCWVKIYW